MTVIYLDQNAASRLALDDDASRWHQIRRIISRGVSKGKVVCPIPLETLVESSPCTTAQRMKIEELFKEIGKDTRFPYFQEAITSQTLSLIRPETSCYSLIPFAAKWGHREVEAATAKSLHRKNQERMKARVAEFLNHQPQGRKRSFDEIFGASAKERSGFFFRDLERFRLSGSVGPTNYERPLLIESLVSHGLTIVEAEALGKAVLKREWIKIPCNWVDLKIGARWDHDFQIGQRPNYLANDELDRGRAAVALCYADVFITDGYLAELCRRCGTISTTKIFSVKQVAEIEALLSNI